MSKRILFETGSRFPDSRLTVLENLPVRNRNSWVRCLCDCGREVEVFAARAKSGNTKSCGCLSVERKREIVKARNKTHGLTRHPLYSIWKAIKSRCGNKKDKDYSRYGGRGIFICEEFRNDFMCFFEHVMSSGWREGLQIDRIDNDKGYEPGNLRFVTSKENNRNRSNNIYYTVGGVTGTLREHAERVGLTLSAVKNRKFSGWKTEDLFLPHA